MEEKRNFYFGPDTDQLRPEKKILQPDVLFELFRRKG